MKQNQPNLDSLPVILQACDANGLPRISFYELMVHAEAGKPPRGYVKCQSLYSGRKSLTRFVPEAALNVARYELDYVLQQLMCLEVTDDVLLAYLLYLLDYGRVGSKMMEHLRFAVGFIDKEQVVSTEQLESTVGWLIRRAQEVYPLETRDYEQEVKERAEWEKETAGLQLIDREKRLNSGKFTAVMEVQDVAGHPRPSLCSIYQRMKSEEPIPGFVANPYKEMHVCPFLLTIPEWCLAGDCDLPWLWKKLKKWKITYNIKDTLLLVHAADWGRKDNACMKLFEDLGKRFTPDKAYLYVVRQLEKQAIQKGTLRAGGKRNNQIVKETLKGQEAKRR